MPQTITTILNALEDYKSNPTELETVLNNNFNDILNFSDEELNSQHPKSGKTLLHYMVIGQCNDAAFLICNKRNPDLTKTDKYNKTPLDYVYDSLIELASSNSYRGAATKFKDTFEKFKNLPGFNINKRHYHGATLLHIATGDGANSEIAKFLIENGADTSITDDQQRTPQCLIELLLNPKQKKLLIKLFNPETSAQSNTTTTQQAAVTSTTTTTMPPQQPTSQIVTLDSIFALANNRQTNEQIQSKDSDFDINAKEQLDLASYKAPPTSPRLSEHSTPLAPQMQRSRGGGAAGAT